MADYEDDEGGLWDGGGDEEMAGEVILNFVKTCCIFVLH